MSEHPLIVFYSMGGNTRRLAEELHAAMGGDLEEIAEIHPRHRGGVGVLRALFDTLLRRRPGIVAPAHRPEDYDVLVLGGPIWAGRIAAPVRTYAERYGGGARGVAFFCTHGGSGSAAAFPDLARLCRHEARGTLAVDAHHLSPTAHRGELGRFTALASTRMH